MSFLRRYDNPNTFNLFLTYLRSFYNWCLDEGHIDENPVRRIKKRRGTNRIVEMDAMDLKRFFAAIERGTFLGDRDMAYMTLMVDTGIRPKEARTLLVSDVDINGLLVSIRGEEAKTRTPRTLPISLGVRKILVKYDGYRQEWWSDHFFCKEDGTPLSERGMEHRFEKYSKVSGVKIFPYALRHAFALLSLRNGADPFWIQSMLGHKGMEMTRRYISLSERDMRDTQRRVSPSRFIRG